MRRSVREALVGFSLLAAISGGFGLWLWLRGVSLGRSTWTVTASFADASGLAERSPVSYRGVLVGSVRSVRVTNRAVLADLEITDPGLRLARPVVAQVGTSSLLGGDAQVALISSGSPLPESLPGPRDRGCDSRRMLCQNAQVTGVATASLQTVTDTVQKLLDQADRDKLVQKMVAATASFEATAREAEKLSKEGQVFVADANRLVGTLNRSAGKIDPILTNANTASAGFARASVDVAQASRHIRNLSAALDNPRTVADLQATLSNAKQLTDRWSAVGGDVRKLTDDPKFMDGIRNVSVGLGRFFEELYPAQTAAAKERDERRRAERQKAADRGAAAGATPAAP
jgi:phospholipid/cholesterol/gamma-HCH transport system substrate-binding protein